MTHDLDKEMAKPFFDPVSRPLLQDWAAETPLPWQGLAAVAIDHRNLDEFRFAIQQGEARASKYWLDYIKRALAKAPNMVLPVYQEGKVLLGQVERVLIGRLATDEAHYALLEMILGEPRDDGHDGLGDAAYHELMLYAETRLPSPELDRLKRLRTKRPLSMDRVLAAYREQAHG